MAELLSILTGANLDATPMAYSFHRKMALCHRPFVEHSGKTGQKKMVMHVKRLGLDRISPEGRNAVLGIKAYIRDSSLDSRLIELVKMRTFQINDCAYCLDVHSKETRKQGEAELHLYLVNASEESPSYSPAERAALGWTEALTSASETHAPDEAYEALRKNFSNEATVDLTILIGLNNLRNRVTHERDKTQRNSETAHASRAAATAIEDDKHEE